MNKIRFSANRNIFIAEELTQENGDRVIYQYEVRIKTAQYLFCVYYSDIVYAGTIVADVDWLSKEPNLKVSFLPCSVILPDDYSLSDITFFSKQEAIDEDNDMQQTQMMESLVEPLIKNFKSSDIKFVLKSELFSLPLKNPDIVFMREFSTNRDSLTAINKATGESKSLPLDFVDGKLSDYI